MLFAQIAYPPIPIFEVGPLRLSLHGLFAAIGFIAGGALATRYLVRRGYDGEKFQSERTAEYCGDPGSFL